jgi:hypothetical protein
MPYALPARLSFCVTGGQAVFLDLEHDRYFRLGGRLDAAFRTLLATRDAAAEDLEALARLGVIRRAVNAENLRPVSAAPVSRSLLETTPSAAAPRLWMTLQVALSVARAWRTLKRHPIAHVMDRLAEPRPCRPGRGPAADGEPQPDIRIVALQFSQARRWIPINTVCLLDSLALLDFLARRRFAATLVMGVKLNPFAAHCWVQHGDLILNDAFDRASAFTPILVVG